MDIFNKANVLELIPDPVKESFEALRKYDDALISMEQWKKKYKKALWLAKLQPNAGNIEITKKTFPFDNASLAMLPFILEAMLDFQSRATPDLVWAKNIVKFKVYGEKGPPDQTGKSPKDQREKRLAEYSNYQLEEEIPNWKEDQDKALLILPCVGTVYKKTDWLEGKIRSDLILADQVVFDHNYKSFEEAPDKFLQYKYTKNEVIGFIRGETQWDIEEEDLDEDQEEFEFIEASTWIDIDEDGLKEPYKIVIFEDRIVYASPEYDEEDMQLNDKGDIVKIEGWHRFTQYRFIPDPDGGPMGLGWGILLGPMFDAINTNLRQMIDAETLSITAGSSGLIAMDTTTGRGNSIESGPIHVQPGEITKISVRGMNGSLSQNIAQFPFRGANETMFRLIDWLSQGARQMTTAALRIEAVPNEAASLYLARLTQGLKVPNAIIMRVFSACQKEFQKIMTLNYKHFDDEKYNRVLDGQTQYRMELDFSPDDCDIKIAHDPTQGSDIERSARSEAVLMAAREQQTPVINTRQAYIDWLTDIGVTNIEVLVPEPQPDPMEQQIALQLQMEAEFKNREMETRERRLKLDEHKVMLDAARQLEEVNLSKDKLESEITLNYAKALADIIKASEASLQKGLQTMKDMETDFIEGGTSGNTGPS